MFEKYTIRRQAKALQKFVGQLPVTATGDLHIVYTPSQELDGIEHELNRNYGYRHRLVARSSLAFMVGEDDSAGIYYATGHALERRAHRFIVGGEAAGAEITYHREPFDIDSQALGSRVLDVMGVDAIAGDEHVSTELAWLAREVRIVDVASLEVQTSAKQHRTFRVS